MISRTAKCLIACFLAVSFAACAGPKAAQRTISQDEVDAIRARAAAADRDLPATPKALQTIP